MKSNQRIAAALSLALLVLAATVAAPALAQKQQQQQDAQIVRLVERFGTEEMGRRLRAGMLPEDELLDLVRERVFAPLAAFPRYQRITKADVRQASVARAAAIREGDDEDLDDGEDYVALPGGEVEFDDDVASEATAEAFAALEDIRKVAEATIPQALGEDAKIAVVLRWHGGRVKRDHTFLVERFSVLVTVESAGFTVSREYAA